MAKLWRSGALCAMVLGAAATAFSTDDRPAIDKLSLAGQVVRQALVGENDRVQIVGPPAEAALLEDLAVEARKRGAHPLITLSSDRLRRRFIEDVPAKYDAQPPRFDLALADVCDVYLAVEPSEDALFGVPPTRMTAVQKAAEAASERMLKRSVRVVSLGNGLYPTPSRAKRFGLTETQLRKVYEAGLGVDSAKLAATGERLRKALVAGKEVRLRTEDGTDLTLRIEKRPVLVSDGVLTTAKVKKGGADCMTWLPAGEVYFTPIPGTGTGTVVAPLAFWEGTEIRKLRLAFKDGKLTSMTAESGLGRLKKVYDAHGPGKEALGAIDIGLNPGVRAPSASKLVSFVAAGTVTVALGNNSWAGGDVTNPFGLNLHLPVGTLSVDGKVLVEKGKLAE